MSRPRPLTERTSQYQTVGPLLPSARANPVMLLMVMGAFAARSEVSAGTLAAAQMRDKEWAGARRPWAAAQGLALGAQGSSLAASAGAVSLVFLGGAVRATGFFGFFGGSAGGCAAVVGVSSAASGAAA